MNILSIINEDGTKLTDYPINPLLEKWFKLYPKNETCKRINELGYANFSCLSCSKCPDGELFEIPKEDLK